MSLGTDISRHATADQDRLLLCKNHIIVDDQVAVLIIKPSNHLPNANTTPANIDSIVGRLREKGWELQAAKLCAAGALNTAKVMAHYPQPFYDSQASDLRDELAPDEQQALAGVWGATANNYPIYHPVQLVNAGRLSYAEIARIWHTGRGDHNKLIDVGSPAGIATITATKNPRYGKRRLLLVKAPGAEPYFILNGFTAELLNKFARPGEQIIAMAFGYTGTEHGLEYIREYVVGTTNPHHAQPGSIRYDALHADTYSGAFPVVSLAEVGIENNLVHLSDSLAEACRELVLWLPELMWYPAQGPFAPDIAFETWEGLRQDYLQRSPRPPLPEVANPNTSKLKRWSKLGVATKPLRLSVNLMAGGSAGRFFGYELPEHQRNKLLAPIVPIGDRTYSFLELQLARLASRNDVEQITLFTSEALASSVQAQLGALGRQAPALAPTLTKTSVLPRRGVPRIIPTAADLLADARFQIDCRKRAMNPDERAQSYCRDPGGYVLSDGTISLKAPGHLSVLLGYIYHRLQAELARGITVAFFQIGEDTGAVADPGFLAHAKASPAVVQIGVIEMPSFQAGGQLVSLAGALQLREAAENPGLSAPFYVNTLRLAVNLPALASFLASDVATFLDLSEAAVRQLVATKIVNKLAPQLEIKPLHNYTEWTEQFAYLLGQISQVVPTEFIVCDQPFPKFLTFKTKEQLAEILPLIRREYAPYLNYLNSST